MTILVTGSAGFLASKLIYRLLSNKHKVVGVDIKSNDDLLKLKNYKEYNINLVDKNKVNGLINSLSSVDIVIHTAAVQPINTDDNYNKYFLGNVVSTYNLIESCIQAKINKFIYSSSFSVYGRPRRPPISENDELKPYNVYGLSKQQAELILK